MGYAAGSAITTGGSNTIIGRGAGGSITTESNNTLIGYFADISAPGASNELNIDGVITGTNTGEKNITLPGTGAIAVHSGTAAQRPASPVNGQIRYNTDANVLEAYINGTWKTITAV
jgi:hypothetical protein